jgi:hypothetical protein
MSLLDIDVVKSAAKVYKFIEIKKKKGIFCEKSAFFG